MAYDYTQYGAGLAQLPVWQDRIAGGGVVDRFNAGVNPYQAAVTALNQPLSGLANMARQGTPIQNAADVIGTGSGGGRSPGRDVLDFQRWLAKGPGLQGAQDLIASGWTPEDGFDDVDPSVLEFFVDWRERDRERSDQQHGGVLSAFSNMPLPTQAAFGALTAGAGLLTGAGAPALGAANVASPGFSPTAIAAAGRAGLPAVSNVALPAFIAGNPIGAAYTAGGLASRALGGPIPNYTGNQGPAPIQNYTGNQGPAFIPNYTGQAQEAVGGGPGTNTQDSQTQPNPFIPPITGVNIADTINDLTNQSAPQQQAASGGGSGLAFPGNPYIPLQWGPPVQPRRYYMGNPFAG